MLAAFESAAACPVPIVVAPAHRPARCRSASILCRRDTRPESNTPCRLRPTERTPLRKVVARLSFQASRPATAHVAVAHPTAAADVVAAHPVAGLHAGDVYPDRRDHASAPARHDSS